jgi:hypothetical protein
LLIAEEQLVVGRVGAVIEYPVVARVISILLCLCTGIDHAKLRRGGDKKHWCFVSGTLPIRVDEVNEGWDPCEVDDLVIALETAWRFFQPSGIGEGNDSWREIVSPSFHSI